MSSSSVLPNKPPAYDRPTVNHESDRATVYGVLVMMVVGLCFTAYSVWRDVDVSGAQTQSILVYLLLAIALVIALGFEFVNGFHDTANAVATVIYTHSLIPNYECRVVRVLGTSSAFLPPRARWRSASSRCCLSS